MPHTTVSSTSTADRQWVLIRCCGLFTHYRPIQGSTALVCTRSGGYEGCGRVIQPSEFPEAAHGDEVTIHNGVLTYGIDPDTTLTRSRQGEFGCPGTFTARELDRRYTAEVCAWQSFEIDVVLLEAARIRECHHASGYGRKTRIIRG